MQSMFENPLTSRYFLIVHDMSANSTPATMEVVVYGRLREWTVSTALETRLGEKSRPFDHRHPAVRLQAQLRVKFQSRLRLTEDQIVGHLSRFIERSH